MSYYGVKSLLKHESIKIGVFSSLIFPVSKPANQNTVTEVEMNSVVSSGNAGSFQKFNDVQGMLPVCTLYSTLPYGVYFILVCFSEKTDSSISESHKVELSFICLDQWGVYSMTVLTVFLSGSRDVCTHSAHVKRNQGSEDRGEGRTGKLIQQYEHCVERQTR